MWLILDYIAEVILASVFLLASIALWAAAFYGPKPAKWLRMLGALTAGSYGGFYVMRLLASMGWEPLSFGVQVSWTRFNATLVASMLAIWVFGRPDRRGLTRYAEDYEPTHEVEEG